MQKRFVELVSSFLGEAGIDCPIIPGENIVAVPVGDFSFSIGLFESRNAIVMQGAAGVLPPSDREAFCAELLRMNSLFRGTGGAAFGLEDDTVTMQAIMHMEGLTQDAFNAQAATFLEALATAMEGFSAIAERAARAASDASDVSGADILAMQNMLRV